MVPVKDGPVRAGVCCMPMGSRTAIITIAAAMAMVVFAMSKPAAGQGGPPPTAVRVGTVDEQTLVERRMVTGDIVAVKRSLVAAREPGLVAQVSVDEGQAVKQGDPLVQL